MKHFQLNPDSLSDPSGAGADELIKLLHQLSSQFASILMDVKAYACHLEPQVIDLRVPETRRLYTDELRQDDLIAYFLVPQDEQNPTSKFFFNRDGTMRIVIREATADHPEGRGGRYTWPRGIEEIYDVLRHSCSQEARRLLKAAKLLKKG
ncbi:MAG: hypothetical protein WCW31_00965 [Patescibacteria group bacterium]